jgi:hypothetical protein
MSDLVLLLLLILVSNLLIGLKGRQGGQKDGVTLGDIIDAVPWRWAAIGFAEVLGGWILLPAVIGKISEIQATNPELASGPNSWFIATLPFLFALVLVLLPASFILQEMERGKRR